MTHANHLGAARVASARQAVEGDLARAIDGHACSRCFEVHPLRRRSPTTFFLVTRKAAVPSDLEARLERASAAWQLTPRQVAVLRRLALGDANKDIAARLAISVRTVEAHLAAMMALAKVESRLKLVARLWAGA